jgi:glycosyltransferase involved in cell wall biosynthesis
MVGHLREEKDPRTLFAAVRRLAHRPDIRIDHIGAALDPALGAEAAQLALQPAVPLAGRTAATPTRGGASRCARAGAHEPHGRRRARGHRGAAQRHAGAGLAHRRQPGAAGRRLPGHFAPGDAAALASPARACRDEPAMLPALAAAAAARAPLFAPEAERAALHALLAELNTGDPSP